MFGTFRVILALLVVIQHLSPLEHFNIGDAAVLNFFIISGYVMTVLIEKSYGKLGKSTFYFYADRFLRIYPQFFFFLILSFIANSIFLFDVKYLSGQPTVEKFLMNALIVPLNYNFIWPELSHYQLMLPAWSLGLEEQFYWIFPFIVLLPFVERISAVLSYIIFALAILGHIPSEFFAYRFLPGVIFIFLLGKNLADYNLHKSKEALRTMLSLYGATAILTALIGAYHPEVFDFGYNKEVLSSILVGFPIITLLSRLPRQRWDEFLGHASYGIFLGHILLKHLMFHFRLYEIEAINGYWTLIILFLVCSIATGYAGYYLIEKPTLRFRHALRARHAKSMSEG